MRRLHIGASSALLDYTYTIHKFHKSFLVYQGEISYADSLLCNNLRRPKGKTIRCIFVLEITLINSLGMICLVGGVLH